jgi:hypothetical protein
MGWRGGRVGGVHVSNVRFGVWRRDRARCVRLAGVAGLVCMCVVGFAGSAMAVAERCPNAALRTGPSASLPDCRAYELVTPEELGRTQSMTFTGSDQAIPSADGEHLALQTFAPLEPDPSLKGARAVFSRTAQGWTMTSAVTPGVAATEVLVHLLSPDLSQIALASATTLSYPPPYAFEVGPVGGPYAPVADIPSGYLSSFSGANAGTVSVPAFTDVLFESTDHELLPPGRERELAEEAVAGASDLYEWTEGKLRLVNVEGEGEHLKLINRCGAGLGAGVGAGQGANTLGAVSEDGSKIFFTSPQASSPCGGGEPPRVYMRVDGRETVEVSKPASGVELKPSERREVRYNVASSDGSEVVFNTGTPLLAGETSSEDKLFIYDTITGDLKLIKSGVPETAGTGGRFVLLSEDGSAVYYNTSESIYRYETQTGKTTFIATLNSSPANFNESSYATPNAQFLVFVGGPVGIEVAGPNGMELEPRGAGHNELYRYDAADGSVMCVSCGEGIAPTEGAMFEPGSRVLETQDETPPFVQMSDNGQRVFFQTSAQLVLQDTNSPASEESSAGGFPGMDVYEWEADGTEEAPGVFCGVAFGCTHLLSSGEDVGGEYFLGASGDGSNVFLSSAAQLLPQATPEFSNIYDARIDGGFPPPARASECLSCQGVGSPPPLFGPGPSGSFAGAGNPALPSSTTPEPKKTTVKCPEGKKLSHGQCVKTKSKKKLKPKRAKKTGRGAR